MYSSELLIKGKKMEHFSKDTEKILSKAETIAFSLNHGFVTSEHVLLALLKDNDQLITKELNRQKIDADTIYKKIKGLFSKKEKDPQYMEYTIELKLLLSKASTLSKEKKEGFITPLILSYAILLEENCGAYVLLKKLKVNIPLLKDSMFANKKNSDLDLITDLHRLGIKNSDPLIGRQSELLQLINALSRRNKPNAILVGEPGVGKTAIVEELAKQLEDNKIPSLLGKRIYELDIASTVGGTKYRGEFEEKIKKILKKVTEEGNVILFIDEIHNIVHAGGAEGAIDASNILKPYLSRGDIQLIGATTEDEFDAVFEKDKPLKRRFQVIKIYQTSIEETKEILYKIKPLYESYYNKLISDDILDEIVCLADIYLKDMSFPDKAIDILDNSLVLSKFSYLTKEDVNKTMSLFYKIERSNKNKIDELFLILKNKIIGQDDALESLYNSLLELDLDVKDENKPLLSLLFLGPVGVGKTLVSKLIGDILFGTENVLVLNMSLYQEPYSLKELLSSNKGIYGEESSSFIKKIKTHPHLLIIFEEIDKASNEVIDFILSILDRGGFYDLNGKYVDMHDVMIIMNTNYGFKGENIFSSNIKRNTTIINEKNILSQRFRQEFISRIDGIIKFNYLNKSSISKISQEYAKDYIFDENELNEINHDEKEYAQYGAFLIKRNVKKALIKNNKKKILN